MSHAIPSDWNDVVRRVSGWLNDATARLDTHESDFVLRFPTTTAPTANGSVHLASQLAQLPGTLKPIDQLVQVADDAAAEPEGSLCDLARRSEGLRLKLVDWVGRAIR